MSSDKREKLQRTLSLLSSGHSVQDISQTLNISRASVYSYFRELGLGKGKWKAISGHPRRNPHIGKAAVKRLYDSGLTIREVAEQLNVSQTTIHNKLKAVNYVPCPQQSRQFIDIDLDKVKEAYDGGKTWSQIAKELNVSTKTLRKKVRASDIDIPSRVTRVSLPDEELLQSYKEGASLGYLASKYEVHRATIIRRLKRLGAEVPVKY